VSVVVGSRNATQVESNVERYQARIPDALWKALAAERLIPELAVQPN
jgi:hypothetical protein